MSIRDTQFTGFAKALLKEIVDDMLDEYGFMDRSYYESGDLNTTEELITRRAYDLAFHSIDHTLDYLQERGMKTPGDMGKRILPSIPDLTELPKEQDDSASIYESLCNDEGVMQVAIQIAKALEPPRSYDDNFGRIISFSEGPEPPKEEE